MPTAGTSATPAMVATAGAPAATMPNLGGAAGVGGAMPGMQPSAAGATAQQTPPTAGTQAPPAMTGAAGAPANQPAVPPPSGLPDVTFGFDVTVPAGAEYLRCQYEQFPSDRGTVAVHWAESHFTPGSHHMLAYRTEVTSVPPDETGVFDCWDGEWQVHDRGSYYEAQQPDSMRILPEGVAHEFKPGEFVILQAHYINTTDKDLNAHVQFILHTIDLSSVKAEAGSILFSNPSLRVPAHAMSRATMTCPITQNINFALLWSHMHSRGIHFLATTDDPTASQTLGNLYESSTWSEPQPREFPDEPTAMIHSGSHVTFYCDYQNDTDNTFVYGNSAATNEMCILHGMYYPRMDEMNEGCYGGMTSNTNL